MGCVFVLLFLAAVQAKLQWLRSGNKSMASVPMKQKQSFRCQAAVQVSWPFVAAMALGKSYCGRFPCTLTSLFHLLVVSHPFQTGLMQMLAMWFDISTILVSAHPGVFCDSVFTNVILCIPTNDLCRIFLLYWLDLTVNNSKWVKFS